MASDSSTADQRVDVRSEQKKVTHDTELGDEEVYLQTKDNAGRDEVDNVKGEGLSVTATTATVSGEKHEAEVKSAIEAKEEDGLSKSGKVENSVLESELSHSLAPISEKNEGETESKADGDPKAQSKAQENIEDIKVPSTSENIQQQVPKDSTGSDIFQNENVEVQTREKEIPVSSKDSEDQVQEPFPSESTLVPDVIETPEKVDVEVGVKGLEVESGSLEEQKHDSSGVVVPDVSEAIEEVDGNQKAVTLEVPVQELEVVLGSPEEEKQEKAIESQEPSSHLTIVDDEDVVVIDSSLLEGKVSGDAEFVGKKEQFLEENTTGMPVETQIQEGLKAKTESTQAPFAKGKSSEQVVVEKNGVLVEVGMEASNIVDASPVAGLSTERGMASELGETNEEEKDNAIESSGFDAAFNSSEGLLEGGTASEGNILFEKQKHDDTKDLKTGLLATSTELTVIEVSSEQAKASATSTELPVVEVSSEQVKAPTESTDLIMVEFFSEQAKAPETFKTVKEEMDRSINIEGENKDLEMISKEPNFAIETNDVTLVGHQVLGDEKTSVNLNQEDATSEEAPKRLPTVNEPSAQAIEKNECINSEKKAPTKSSRGLSLAEAFSEELKDIEASETVVEKKDETSRELGVEKPSFEEVDIGPSDVAEEIKHETLREQHVEEKHSTKEIKDIEASGTIVEVKQISREHTVEENNSNVPEDKKEEVKISEAIQTATGKQKHEELSDRKAESENAKDQGPIISSDTADSKKVKEVPKRALGNIFSKFKRSIVKAKKAILGKSSSTKTIMRSKQ